MQLFRLGYLAARRNEHYFELDQLYHVSQDPDESDNLLYGANAKPKPEGTLTQAEAAKLAEMQALLTSYLQKFPDRPFGEFYDGK